MRKISGSDRCRVVTDDLFHHFINHQHQDLVTQVSSTPTFDCESDMIKSRDSFSDEVMQNSSISDEKMN